MLVFYKIWKKYNEIQFRKKMETRSYADTQILDSSRGLKKSKMPHYHEALNNARKNPKDTWNLLRQLVPGKSKQTKCNFQNPTRSASTFDDFFATAGEKTYNDVKQRHQTNGFDVQARHERTHPRITKKSSLWSPQPVQAADVILARDGQNYFEM